MRAKRERADVVARFVAKFKAGLADECWLWMAARNSKGYGGFRGFSGEPIGAHRFAYELAVGPIAPGMTIDHMCGNPSCVNPSHLRQLTMRDNNLAGNGFGGKAHKTNRCIRGHELTPDNVWQQTGTGHRYCRACAKLRQRRVAA